MTDFGGLGGNWGEANFDEDYGHDLFAQDLNKALGDDMRQDDSVCEDVWAALANIGWEHKEGGHTASYSFRAAGDLVAAIKGEGMYMDWYCCKTDGVVQSYIYHAMKTLGWTYTDEEDWNADPD